jgi:hypothetical protein
MNSESRERLNQRRLAGLPYDERELTRLNEQLELEILDESKARARVYAGLDPITDRIRLLIETKAQNAHDETTAKIDAVRRWRQRRAAGLPEIFESAPALSRMGEPQLERTPLRLEHEENGKHEQTAIDEQARELAKRYLAGQITAQEFAKNCSFIGKDPA